MLEDRQSQAHLRSAGAKELSLEESEELIELDISDDATEENELVDITASSAEALGEKPVLPTKRLVSITVEEITVRATLLNWILGRTKNIGGKILQRVYCPRDLSINLSPES